ncbi:pentatricopeptide repeat-containing protein, chloroplastic [Cinnamomum micranthum f. kanehirae]|uniref:Pentatricopeptide repeat-containing protein, chloroplastic n=1 Tax=Cinnamomum micranthum f. kanehirae TaxID=337451 RepID=A0A443Q296_9MAGN|nr:pentatricopeptide repeat-containing protein, chloroplastic [Cinnamomum micranthum f. kanehirae]
MASMLPLPLPSSPAPPSHRPQHDHHNKICISPPQTQQNTYISQLSTTAATTKTQSPPQPSPQPKSKPTIRSRLSQLCKDGRPDIALRLFDALPRPSTLLWNTILIGFICNAMPLHALRLFARISSSPNPPSPDSYTFSSALKACAQSQNLKLGKALHCQMLRTHFRANPVLANSLLSMYATCLYLSFELAKESSSKVGEFARADVVRNLFDRMRRRNAVTWNTMIGWYAKTGRPVEAIMQFKLMVEMGIKPTVVSFVNVLPVAAGVGDRRNSDALYGMLLKLGPDYSNDPFPVSCAIFMYSELSAVDCARMVFDSCVERNIEVWNTMIDGYVQNDCPEEATDLFIQILHEEKIFPDSVTFLVTLMAVSQLQQLEFGKQIHAYVIKYSAELPVILSNALVVMYSRCDSVEMAFSVFEKMLERDVVTWNTMVSAFVQNGFDVEGLLLVCEMQKQGVYIDSVTAIALLSAASNLGNIRIGKETHAYLIRHGLQFEGMNSYLIDMYAKAGSIETAERLFEKDNNVHDRDQVTWNSMIAAYMQNGQVEKAITVLRQMLEQNQVPTAPTLASVLPACNLTRGISFGKQIHSFSIRHSLDENVFVGTSLVDIYSKCGLIDYAERLFDRMPMRNSVTYTTMISSYGQHGLGDRALSLFWAMPEAGMKPDVITFVAILSACSYSGLIDEGIEMFKLMETEYGISATPEHYCCIVDMLGRAGRIVEAYEFVKELGDKGNVAAIWGSLLGACRIHGELELVKLVAEKLFEIEEGNGTAGYHILLSNIYAAEGMWQSVDGVRKGMGDKGLRKEAGYSWIEVGGTVHQFMSRDQRHPQHDEVYAMLEELAVEMKMAGYRLTISDDNGAFESD